MIWRPPAADSLGWLIGLQWPEGNEDEMWGLADDWKKAAAQLKSIKGDVDGAISAVRQAYPQGGGGEEMIKQLESLKKGDNGGDGSLDSLVKWFGEIAGLAENTGTEFEYTKLMFHATLLIMAVDMAIAAASLVGAPAAEAAVIAVNRVTVRQIMKKLLARLAGQGVKFSEIISAQTALKALRMAGISAVLGAGLGAAPDAIIQTWQHKQGRRQDINWEQTRTMAWAGAAGGLAAAGIGGAMRWRIGTPATRGGRVLAAGGIMLGAGAGAAGAGLLTSGLLSGHWEFDPRMITAGMFGGAAPGMVRAVRPPKTSTPKTNVAKLGDGTGALSRGGSGGAQPHSQGPGSHAGGSTGAGERSPWTPASNDGAQNLHGRAGTPESSGIGDGGASGGHSTQPAGSHTAGDAVGGATSAQLAAQASIPHASPEVAPSAQGGAQPVVAAPAAHAAPITHAGDAGAPQGGQSANPAHGQPANPAHNQPANPAPTAGDSRTPVEQRPATTARPDPTGNTPPAESNRAGAATNRDAAAAAPAHGKTTGTEAPRTTGRTDIAPGERATVPAEHPDGRRASEPVQPEGSRPRNENPRTAEELARTSETEAPARARPEESRPAAEQNPQKSHPDEGSPRRTPEETSGPEKSFTRPHDSDQAPHSPARENGAHEQPLARGEHPHSSEPELTPAEQAAKDACDALPQIEREAINDYAGPAYNEINRHLRYGEPLETVSPATIEHIRSGLEKLPNHVGPVKRSIMLSPEQMEKFWQNNRPDTGVEDPGFVSTSKDKFKWNPTVKLTILSETGKDISFLRPPGKRGEAEVLIPDGRQFRVKSRDMDADGVMHVVWEEIPEAQRAHPDDVGPAAAPHDRTPDQPFPHELVKDDSVPFSLEGFGAREEPAVPARPHDVNPSAGLPDPVTGKPRANLAPEQAPTRPHTPEPAPARPEGREPAAVRPHNAEPTPVRTEPNSPKTHEEVAPTRPHNEEPATKPSGHSPADTSPNSPAREPNTTPEPSPGAARPHPVDPAVQYPRMRKAVADIYTALQNPAEAHNLPAAREHFRTLLDEAGLRNRDTADSAWRHLSDHDPELAKYLSDNHNLLLPHDPPLTNFARPTEGGVSLHDPNDPVAALAAKVTPDPHFFDIDGHLTKDGNLRIGDRLYTMDQLAEALPHLGWDGKTPFRLIGCDAATSGAALHLARLTGADVLAGTDLVWTDPQGRVYTSSAEPGPNGTLRPRIPPNGTWEICRPDGTKFRVTEDGFAPGTPEKDRNGLHPDAAWDRSGDHEHAKPNEEEVQEVSGSSSPAKPEVVRQLLDDAQALHDTVSAPKYGDSPVGAKIADQGTTVATGLFDDQKVYSVNNNKTTRAMRKLAEELGYERIFGMEHIDPGIRTDAEQIIFNAVDDGTLPQKGVVASSRPACGPERQNCAGRADEYPDVSLWERKRTLPWERDDG
ncbi:ADP-ribosyltransferase [Nocardia inohanensis]|uniref:WXG100-like domain-containing protein n=1 Tax=Nocardia inohanensis TaxID=209246 RepID=UPI00082F5058|nr:ADP-ribosyltransferase [Nocardia inohanensis]